MLGEEQPHGIMQRTREEVARFEVPSSDLSLDQFLRGCNLESVVRIERIDNPSQFVAWLYDLVRRVEAAAAKHSDEGDPRISSATEAVRSFENPIVRMMLRVQEMSPTTQLEELGKELSLDILRWARWVLAERLAEWGY